MSGEPIPQSPMAEPQTIVDSSAGKSVAPAPMAKAVRPIADASAPPAVAKVAPQAGRFYRVDSSKCSLKELWRDCRGPGFLIAIISKVFRLKLPGSVNDPNVVALRPFYVRATDVEAQVPEEFSRDIGPVVRELRELGFGEPVCFLIDDRFHGSKTVQMAMLHRDGKSVVRVTRRAEGIGGKKIHFFTEFLSGFKGRQYLWSSSANAQLFVPEAVKINWDRKANTSQLWVSHRRELDQMVAAGSAVYQLKDRVQLVALLERHHEAIRDFQLERGVFASMKGDDLAQVEALDRNLGMANEGQIRYPEVMSQIERLQNKKADITSGLLILIVSIGLFFGLGIAAWGQSWQFIAMLIGVLFIHELGHYLAMRVFGYKNVRMFFIPLFGAAVSGQNYTAPGWKKVMVSLMGPLPGIYLGAAIGVYALFNDHESLTMIALLTILLNAMQLIPVLPLDGGRVVQALIFCRHFYLDAIFHIGTAVILLGLGAMIGDRILIGLGVVMLISVPSTIKIGQIVSDLKTRGFSTGETGSVAPLPPVDPTITAPPITPPQFDAPVQTSIPIAEIDKGIPTEIAEPIIDQITSRFPSLKSSKQIAEMTLRVYETLVTRPPSVLASVGFGFLHGGSFVFALIFLAVIAVGRSDNFRSMMGDFGGYQLEHQVDPATMTTWKSTAAADEAGGTPTVANDGQTEVKFLVVTFKSVDAAKVAGEKMKLAANGQDAEALQFGQTVTMRSTNAAMISSLFDKYEAVAEEIFVSTSSEPITMSLSARASTPQVAESTIATLNGCFRSRTAGMMIAPWTPEEIDSRTPEERYQHEVARKLLVELEDAHAMDHPDLKKITDELQRAMRRSDTKKQEMLLKALTKKRLALTRIKLEEILNRETRPELREMIEKYIPIRIANDEFSSSFDFDDETDDDSSYREYEEKLRQFQNRFRSEIGPYVGSWPEVDEHGAPIGVGRAFASSHGWGMQLQDGDQIQVTVGLYDIVTGLPVLLNWFEDRGFTEFRYQVQHFSNDYYDLDY